MYFNTSHVNVNQEIPVTDVFLKSYFNTSHVNVNLEELSFSPVEN